MVAGASYVAKASPCEGAVQQPRYVACLQSLAEPGWPQRGSAKEQLAGQPRRTYRLLSQGRPDTRGWRPHSL